MNNPSEPGEPALPSVGHHEGLKSAQLVPVCGSGIIALHCTALHCTALHCTALHFTALHCTALHCTLAGCTAPDPGLDTANGQLLQSSLVTM
jgi:hypothetical protein